MNKQILEKLLIELITLEYAWGSILTNLPKQFTSNGKFPACLARKRYYTLILDDCLFKRPKEEIVFILKHEALHLLLKHLDRCKDIKDLHRWNIAADLAVNQMLQRTTKTSHRIGSFKTSVDMSLPKDAILPERCNPPLPKDLSAEEYFKLLSSDNNYDIDIQGDTVTIVDPRTNTVVFSGKITHDTQELLAADNSTSDVVIENIIRDINDKLEGKSIGTLPMELSTALSLWLPKSETPWQEIVKRHVVGSLKGNYKCTWGREHKRYGNLLPGRIRSRTINAFVAIDSSGSTQYELNSFASELHKIFRIIRGNVKVIVCDCKIHDVYTFKGKIKDNTFRGGGGTSFIPVFDFVKTQRPQPDVLIYLTDTCGDFPNYKPSYKVLWCTKERNTKLPFGTKIIIK